MTITRPCPTDGSPAAAALYLQSLALDLELEFTRLMRQLSSTDVNAAVVMRVTANYNTFATATIPQDLFLTNTVTDLFLAPGASAVDGSGLWLYGFSVQCNPSGADTVGSMRNMALDAGYTDTLGVYNSWGNVQDTIFESADVPGGRMNAASSFVVPPGMGISVPEFPSQFTHGNVASPLIIQAGTMMWAFRVTPDSQITTVM